MNPGAHGARTLLRLLLGDAHAGQRMPPIAWDELLSLALRNGVLLRTVQRLPATTTLPPAVAAAIAAERRRVAATVAVVRQLSLVCAERGIPHVFISALQHLPDVGLDVDLLVPAHAPDLDAAINTALGTGPLPRGIGARLAGAVTYPGGGAAVPLDVHRGRLGVAGEHAGFPAVLLEAARTTGVGADCVPVPTPDDQMVLQGMHRVYGRRAIRLGDLVTTVTSMCRDALDWDYILARSDETGTTAGLSCYLRYVDAIHREVLDRPLLDDWLAERLDQRRWGTVSLRDGVLRLPVLRVNARLFPRAIVRQVRTRNWLAAARLCLVPAVMVEASLRRLARRHGLVASPQGA